MCISVSLFVVYTFVLADGVLAMHAGLLMTRIFELCIVSVFLAKGAATEIGFGKRFLISLSLDRGTFSGLCSCAVHSYNGRVIALLR